MRTMRQLRSSMEVCSPTFHTLFRPLIRFFDCSKHEAYTFPTGQHSSANERSHSANFLDSFPHLFRAFPTHLDIFAHLHSAPLFRLPLPRLSCRLLLVSFAHWKCSGSSESWITHSSSRMDCRTPSSCSISRQAMRGVTDEGWRSESWSVANCQRRGWRDSR